MNLLFLSNYFTHHQRPLSDALVAMGAQYHFIATREPEAERQRMGWCENVPDYVCHWGTPESEALLREADAVIAGSAPEEVIQKAIAAGKLVLRYCERPLKKGLEPLKYLPRLIKWHRNNPKGRPIYLLCASAYTAGDYRKFGLFRGRAYRWGYFPETKSYDLGPLMAGKSRKQLLWCGRLLPLKHLEHALLAADKLQHEGWDFTLHIAGDGPMDGQLRQMTRQYGLEDRVHFLGIKKPEEIRSLMEGAGIYLFTSDRQEGWGAVLNEAMNSGCAVVASDAIGAVPYLLENGKNGLVYPSGDVEALCSCIRSLLREPARQEGLGREAYRTITGQWNAQVAAERLVSLVKTLMAGEDASALYADGPCSADHSPG